MQTPVAQAALQQFLQQLGADDFLWDGQPITIDYEQSGTLYFEITGRGLLLVKMVAIEEYQQFELSKIALRTVCYEQGLPLPVATGLYGDRQLAVLCTLPVASLTLASINEALALLDHVHEQIKQAGES